MFEKRHTKTSTWPTEWFKPLRTYKIIIIQKMYNNKKSRKTHGDIYINKSHKLSPNNCQKIIYNIHMYINSKPENNL